MAGTQGSVPEGETRRSPRGLLTGVLLMGRMPRRQRDHVKHAVNNAAFLNACGEAGTSTTVPAPGAVVDVCASPSDSWLPQAYSAAATGDAGFETIPGAAIRVCMVLRIGIAVWR